MILVDSCGWLEYFAEGARADSYAKYLKKVHELIVPTIILYEVYKKVKREVGEEQALRVVAAMQAGTIIPLPDSLALAAADLSLQFSLPMADAIVYATARAHDALLVTSDEHFKNLEGIEFIK